MITYYTRAGSFYLSIFTLIKAMIDLLIVYRNNNLIET